MNTHNKKNIIKSKITRRKSCHQFLIMIMEIVAYILEFINNKLGVETYASKYVVSYHVV